MRPLILVLALIALAFTVPTPALTAAHSSDAAQDVRAAQDTVTFLVDIQAGIRLRPRSNGGNAGSAPTLVLSPQKTLIGVFKCLT